MSEPGDGRFESMVEAMRAQERGHPMDDPSLRSAPAGRHAALPSQSDLSLTDVVMVGPNHHVGPEYDFTARECRVCHWDEPAEGMPDDWKYRGHRDGCWIEPFLDADCGEAVVPFSKRQINEHSHVDAYGEGGSWTHIHEAGAFPDHEDAFHHR